MKYSTGAALQMLYVIFLFLSILSPGLPAYSKDVNCLQCHKKLILKKGNHQAVTMGCPSCHASLDATSVPHKSTGAAAKGLTSDQPELCYACHDSSVFSKKNVHAAVGMGCTGCHNPHSSTNDKLLKSKQPDVCYGCHDKSLFTKKTVHAAVDMGCTGCHNPHSSDNQKLLASLPPDLCFNCHDKSEFGRKNVHPPVAGGMCLSCHGPHSSDSPALLSQAPVALCLSCHPDVESKPHVIKGFSNKGHPLGNKDKADPKRPGKKFYCGSCHNPHSSDFMKLFRYGAKAKMGLCINCHKF